MTVPSKEPQAAATNGLGSIGFLHCCCESCEDSNDVAGSIGVSVLTDEKVSKALVLEPVAETDHSVAEDHDGELVERREMSVQLGSRYQGQWKGSQCHGKGRLLRPDGSWYQGEFVSGRAHGDGKFVAVSGNSYEGQWDQDCAHGHGKYTHEDGSVYIGEWSNDEKCGQGSEKWSDGSRYQGEFQHGSKHAWGRHHGMA